MLILLFNEFLRFKESYCAVPSVKYYRENVLQFLKWLAGQNDVILDDLSTDMLSRTVYLNYMIYLKSINIKNVSINTYIRAVKVFVKWLYEENYLQEDITLRIKYPRSDAAFIYPLTIAEVEKIDSIFDTCTYLGLRNYCIFHLMLDCGLRSGEIVDLKREHLKGDFILIYDSKFNKSRNVPLPAFLCSPLKTLCRITVSSCVPYVFLDRFARNRLTEGAVKSFFSTLKNKSGVKRVHAHLLRHTFASSYIFYGGNLELLRVLLGHGSYYVTQNYLHIASQMLITGYDMYKIDDVFFNLTNRR